MPAKTKKTAAPTASKPTSVQDFKQKAGGLMELPSGAFVKVRNPGGMKAFLEAGIVPNSLMTIVDEALKTGNTPDMSKLTDNKGGMDEKTLGEMLDLMDNITIMVMKDPQVYAAPENEDDREDDKLYIDELDAEDKMFLFQWATGGTRDLERFRSELASGVEHLSGGQDVGGKTKRAPQH